MNDNHGTWQKIVPYVWGVLQFVLWVLAGLFAVAFALTMFWDDATPFFSRAFGMTGESSKFFNKTGALEFIMFIIGGLIAALGAIAIHRRAEAQIKSAEAQAETAQAQKASAEAQIQSNKFAGQRYVEEKFRAAFTLIDDNSPIQRINAYHELYQMAQDYKNLTATIFHRLCTHLRTITRDPNYEGKSKPTEGVQTLLDLLFKFKDGKTVFRGLAANLRDAVLNGADLRHTCMQGAKLGSEIHGADFTGAQLQKADFSGQNLNDVVLVGASLQGAMLSDITLNGFVFKVQMQGADLYKADLQGAGLVEAQFQGANLEDAKLNGANIERAKFHGAVMVGADCRTDKLNGAQFQGEGCHARFHDMWLSISTVDGDNNIILPDCIFFGKIPEKEARETEEMLVRYADKHAVQRYKDAVAINKGRGEAVYGLHLNNPDHQEAIKIVRNVAKNAGAN